MAVVGFFLVEGKTFVLQCKVFQVSTCRVISGDEYRFTIVKDNLLEVAVQSSAKVADWIKHEFLSEVVVQLEAEKIFPLRNLFLKMRDSRIGIIFTNRWLFALVITAGFFLLALALVNLEKFNWGFHLRCRNIFLVVRLLKSRISMKAFSIFNRFRNYLP